ncbi:MAG: tetratricopeptide repeat protein [Parcubacteria group bacterium]|nr:tetratricopeptide repeat protein [Parcubacteria group bacterium]
MTTTILIILIVGSLIGMGVIVVRKLPQLSIIEVESVKSKREAKIKQDILINRLKRLRAERLVQFIKTVAPLIGPFAKKAKDKFVNLYQGIVDIERKHRRQNGKKQESKTIEVEETLSQVEVLLEEADELLKRDNLRDAEKRYLEAISLDYKNVASYEGLGGLYLKKREYKEAKETFEFILKLDPERPDIYFDLAEASVGLGDGNAAIENLSKALELQPNNPKYLDYLIEVGIMSKNYKIVRIALEKLKEVNPDNQKIKEFEMRMKEMGK